MTDLDPKDKLDTGEDQDNVKPPEMAAGDPPEAPLLLCRITASLFEDGKVDTKMEGEFQNMVIMRGLIALLEHEIGNLQSLQPGATRTPESKLLGHLVQTMNNVSNVLVNVNGVLIALQQQVNAIPQAVLSGTDLTKEDLE